MHFFNYHENEMFCEDVPITEIAAEVGTPFFLYSHATLTRHFNAIDKAFEGVDKLVCYSAKANTSLAILKLLADMGGGLDIVSGGELYKGLKAGFPPGRIVYSGVGKRVDEIDLALETGIMMFNVESLQELEVISQRAKTMRKNAPVSIRVNPDVDAKTHPYISTGLEKNKFGIDTETSLKAYEMARDMDHVEVVGIDCHIGSQITEADPFRAALKSLKELIRQLMEAGIQVKYLDMGGGLGITYDQEEPPDPGVYARAIVETLEDLPVQLILEPGRVIVGNAGVLISRVLYLKSSKTKNFVIIDAGMNDLIRPTLYGAFHRILPVIGRSEQTITADVVGPICETGDFLAQDRELSAVERDDLIAVMSAGAYGFAMSSNYCSRLRVAEVMVKGDSFEVIRERQQYEDLILGESIPSFL
jgi:diaminopimelate decarboxylase